MKKVGLQMKIALQCVLVASLMSVVSGCRKDLCFNHDEHSPAVRADVQPDWMQEWENPYLGGEIQLDWGSYLGRTGMGAQLRRIPSGSG